MGYNTAAIILNDQMHEFERNPNFASELHSSILSANRTGGFGPNGIHVLPSQHADTIQIVAIGCNCIRNLGFGHWKDSDEQLLKTLANSMGYDIRKKRKAKE